MYKQPQRTFQILSQGQILGTVWLFVALAYAANNIWKFEVRTTMSIILRLMMPCLLLMSCSALVLLYVFLPALTTLCYLVVWF